LKQFCVLVIACKLNNVVNIKLWNMARDVSLKIDSCTTDRSLSLIQVYFSLVAFPEMTLDLTLW